MSATEIQAGLENFSLSLNCAAILNLVAQQNSRALIRQIELTAGAELAASQLQIQVEPACFKALQLTVSPMAAEQTLLLEYPLLDYDLTMLQELMADSTAQIKLQWSDADGQVLATVQQQIELLNPATWAGQQQALELLGGFCLGSASALEPLVQQVEQDLAQNQQNRSADQPAPAIEIQRIEALWHTLLEQEIGFESSAENYVQTGQAIRLPKQLLTEKKATSLDSGLLLAALIESMGMDPLIVLEQQHSYVGVWLIESPLLKPVLEDLSVLKQQVELGHLFLIDISLMSQKSSFARAENTALSLLTAPPSSQKFKFALDIRQCRLADIPPLRIRTEQDLFIADAEFTTTTDAAANGVEPHNPRVSRWLRGLLDLSLRNKMLNFKDNRFSIPLSCHHRQLSALEDALHQQQGFAFRSLESLQQPSLQIRDVLNGNQDEALNDDLDDGLDVGLDGLTDGLNEEQENDTHQSVVPTQAQQIEQHFQQNRLISRLEPDQLDKRLVEIFRGSRTALEEGGANTLFLAIGFLEWKESAQSTRVYKAPLLLIPVRLTRETAKTGYKVFSYDDEPRFNDTLLQLLKQDFQLDIAGLSPLPMDAAGVDVNRVLQRVQHAIADLQGWSVKAEAVLGQFSFAKYLMWLDLSSRVEQLKHQAVVKHLIETPRDAFAQQAAFPQAKDLDIDYPPATVFTPLSADSSQLAAVMSATLGRTFILSGPPGTGKSQTITNMIAQCLADQKTVLFVSEKMAALDVVYRRLSQMGLEHLCLELHSAKAQKMQVLDQLRVRVQTYQQALASQQSATAGQLATDVVVATGSNPQNDLIERSHDSSAALAWKACAAQLSDSRTELNQQVAVLHQAHPIGWSLFSAMSEELKHRHLLQLRFPDVDIRQLTAQQREQFSTLLQQAAHSRMMLSDTQLQSLAGFGEGLTQAVWSVAWQDQYLMLQQQLPTQIEQVLQQIAAWQQAFAWPVKNQLGQLKSDVETLTAIVDQLYDHDAQAIDLSLLALLITIDGNLIQQAQQQVSELEQLRQQLVSHYQADIYQADLKQLAFKWREAEAKLWPFSWFSKFQLRNLMRTYLDHSQQAAARPTALAVAHDLPILQKIQILETQFQQRAEQLAQSLQGYWQGEQSDWMLFGQLLGHWQQITQALAKQHAEQISAQAMAEPPEQVPFSIDSIQLLKALQFSQKHPLDAVQQAFDTLQQAVGLLLPDQLNLDALSSQSAAQTYHHWSFSDLLARQQQLQMQRAAWRHWLNWQVQKQQLKLVGLGPLAQHLSAVVLDATAAEDLLQVNLARHFIADQFEQYPGLNLFNHLQHEQQIDRFIQQDASHQQLASQEIIQRRNAMLVQQHQQNNKPEWALLHKELNKKRRHIPVRELIRQIPNIMPGLKPCLLMSPLSVAQYLDSEAKFDLVIFDEASQIPVWDAIGALARGQQSIIVGDQKQMPPTNFFNKADADEEIDEDITEDLESILDECIAAQLPELALTWHYRSRFESLIQFSNQRFYQGELLTFPAPVLKDHAVQLHLVNGVYDKGNSRTNLIEAQAIVAFMLQHLQTQLGQVQPLTLGVVTFNMNQQKLIEDLLDQALSQAPELENLAKAGLEPLFVKNLENVQGDERDIILFSITYAADQQGRLAMNFGALNRVGGQRRLNVAITRARQALHVFSSLAPEQIDLSRSNSEGVRDLKDFLVFARSGQLEIAAQQHGNSKQAMLDYLATQLADLGWKFDLAVGCGQGSVDLAIYDATKANQYIAGLLIDGENYAKAATARDREQLRPLVLRGLGWTLLPIWSIDWWLEPEANLAKLNTQLQQLQQAEQQRA